MELKNGAHAVVKRAGNRWLYIVEGWGSISKRSRAAFDEAVDARDACETHCRDKGLLEDE